MQKLKFDLMSAALECARFGLCVVDESGRVVLANDAFLKKLAISSEALLGTSFLSLHRIFGGHPDFFKAFKSNESEMSIECKATVNGQARYLLLQSSNFKHESGETFRTVSMIDITDYGISRDKLVELRRQVEALNNAVVIVDAKAPDMPISYVNAHFEKMTGYTSKETVGRNCRFLQGSDTKQEEVVRLRQAIQSGQSCQVTLRNYRKDGSAFINELYVSPVFDESGELTHFIGVQHEANAKMTPGV